MQRAILFRLFTVLSTATASVLIIASSAVAGQAGSVCDAFAAADIQALIGPVKQQTPMGGDMCTWTSEHTSLMVTRETEESAEQAQSIVQVAAQGQEGRVTRDETGVGDKAISSIAQKDSGLSVIFSKGAVVWTLVVSHDSADTFNGAEMLSKLKGFAQKAALAR